MCVCVCDVSDCGKDDEGRSAQTPDGPSEVFQSPSRSAQPSPAFTFVGTASDLRAYLEAQTMAQNTDQGSYLLFKTEEGGARRHARFSSVDQKADDPARPCLTLGAVRQVFYRLADPDAARIAVGDLPHALDLLGVPPISRMCTVS